MITKTKKLLLRNALVLACMATMSGVSAQDLLLANNQLSKSQANNSSGRKVLLADVLQNLQQQHHVSFLYETQNLEGKLVAAGAISADKIENGLDKLLATVELRYSKINDRTYAILPLNKNKEGNLPNAFDPLTNGQNANAGSDWLAKNRPEKLSSNFLNWQITGKVTGANGEALPGVTVLLKGTTNGATTGPDGTFSLSIPEQAGTLVFSFIGYTSKEVPVTGPGPVSVTLSEDTQALEEVVVVGYGTQKKEAVTGAITSVGAKQIAEIPVPNVQQAMQGRAAGVMVVNQGSPGTAPNVRIRGIGSISFGTEPLYVVDGVPTGGMNNIDPKDIQSVDVLKDAAATAVYGSRAANGVVIITTKNGGRDGKFRVNLDSNVGVQNTYKMYDLLNTEQYIQYGTTLTRNNNPTASLPPRFDQLDQTIPGTNQTYRQTNTNWMDELFQPGLLTQHNLSLSGGTDRSQFYTSGGYYKQEGTMVGLGFERYNARINTTHKLNNIVTIGQTLTAGYNQQDYDNSAQRSRIVNAIRMVPYLPVTDPTTNSGYREVTGADANDPDNPVRLSLLNTAERRNTNIIGNVNVEVKLTDWLRFKTIGGIDYFNNLDFQRQPQFQSGSKSNANLILQNNRSTGRTLLTTNQLTLDKTLGDHYVNLIAVYERQGNKSLQENITGNQPNNTFETLYNATQQVTDFRRFETLLISYLSRLNYEYKGKYLLSASFRRDGFSVFAPGNQWGNFPGASIGWRVTEEPFMKGITALSELKLRGSYGSVGFNNIGAYPWQANALVNNANYQFGGTSPVNSSYYNGISNTQLGWEITRMVNYGVDFGFLNNRITFSAEYFDRTTTDENRLILQVPTAPSFGFTNATVAQNIGKMKNSGVEFQLGYNENEKPFKWSVNANASVIRNKVMEMSPALPFLDAGANQDFGNTDFTRTTAGQPIQSFYGWVIDGIYQTQDEVNSDNVKPTADARATAQKLNPNITQEQLNNIQGYRQNQRTAPGDFKFQDLNGDGKIDNNDRTFLGSPWPTFQYGLNASANYRNFDLSLFIQGVTGNKIYNATRVQLEGGQRLFNAGTAVLNAWTPTNTNTDVPRMIASDPNGNNRTSGRFLEDGSYTRLKNISVGYSIPQTVLGSFGNGKISGIRIYVQSTNLFTITKYSGLDPEVGALQGQGATLLTNGVDFGQYPQPRSFVGGIQLSF